MLLGSGYSVVFTALGTLQPRAFVSLNTIEPLVLLSNFIIIVAHPIASLFYILLQLHLLINYKQSLEITYPAQ